MDVAVAEVAECACASLPGNACSTAADASAMKRGIAATGTETSCAVVGPSLRSASEMPSRMRQKASACASLLDTVASSTRPASIASAEQLLQQRGGIAIVGAGRFDQHVPAVVAFERVARAGDVPEHQVERVAGDELEALDPVGPRLAEAQQLQRRLRIGDAGPRDRARR